MQYIETIPLLVLPLADFFDFKVELPVVGTESLRLLTMMLTVSVEWPRSTEVLSAALTETLLGLLEDKCCR